MHGRACAWLAGAALRRAVWPPILPYLPFRRPALTVLTHHDGRGGGHGDQNGPTRCLAPTFCRAGRAPDFPRTKRKCAFPLSSAALSATRSLLKPLNHVPYPYSRTLFSYCAYVGARRTS